MPRSMVGLLAAIGAAMSILAGHTKGCLVWLVGAFAAVSTGFAAYMAIQGPFKKTCWITMVSMLHGPT